MATHNPTAGAPAAPSRLSWAPLGAAVAATVGFAFLAFRLSFESLTGLAVEHGIAPDIVWMFAVLVDGGAVVGTVGVVSARRAGRPTVAYWLTVVAFASVSLAFNIGHSDGTGAGIAVAVVPPVAQLVATELLVRMLPTAGATAAVDDVAPAVAAATDAARHAQAAANAAHTDATAVHAALDTAARTVADAVDRTLDAATVATDAAARAEQAAATLTDAAAPPLALVDLAAAVAAVDGPPAAEDVTDAPAPLPLAATFTAPPLPTPAPFDDDATPGAPASTTGAAPTDAVAAYRRLHRETGKRPTAEALGQALGLKRTRGSELRITVERALGIHLATVIKS
ncbi:DUF2637 domain-containing protein [Streptomyces noursei]|uniref:DUF2637 domain-containing protein n=1 Tax=Streptomyces noursei TaxID=1971 RepID=UPI0019668701|nr:DUF2637 domain-containing protein [Streptomyces noursei]QRX93382.1 DUF2637 domain-containing protein [Streptomyces noursei]